MTDYSELIERLEAWSDLDTESGHNSRAETMLRAATAIRDLIAERDAAIGALEFQGTWNEAIEAAKARRAIYAKKWANADPFGPEAFNRHELMQHTMEAFDYLLADFDASARALTKDCLQELDPDAATGCADDKLLGTAQDWRDALEQFEPKTSSQ